MSEKINTVTIDLDKALSQDTVFRVTIMPVNYNWYGGLHLDTFVVASDEEDAITAHPDVYEDILGCIGTQHYKDIHCVDALGEDPDYLGRVRALFLLEAGKHGEKGVIATGVGEGTYPGANRREDQIALRGVNPFQTHDATYRTYVSPNPLLLWALPVNPRSFDVRVRIALVDAATRQVFLSDYVERRDTYALCPWTASGYLTDDELYAQRCVGCADYGQRCQAMWSRALFRRTLLAMASEHGDALLDCFNGDGFAKAVQALEAWEDMYEDVAAWPGAKAKVYTSTPLLAVNGGSMLARGGHAAAVHRTTYYLALRNTAKIKPLISARANGDSVYPAQRCIEDLPRVAWVPPYWLHQNLKYNQKLSPMVFLDRSTFEREKERRSARAKKAAATRAFKAEECAKCVFGQADVFAEATCTRYKQGSNWYSAACSERYPDFASVADEVFTEIAGSPFATFRDALVREFCRHRYVSEHWHGVVKRGNAKYVISGPWLRAVSPRPSEGAPATLHAAWRFSDGSQRCDQQKPGFIEEHGRTCDAATYSWEELWEIIEAKAPSLIEERGLWDTDKILRAYQDEARDEDLFLMYWAAQYLALRRDYDSYAWTRNQTHSYELVPVYGESEKTWAARITFKGGYTIKAPDWKTARAMSGRDRGIAWYT